MRTLWVAVQATGLFVAYAAQSLRWLRVLQREHYEPAATIRFWYRWTGLGQRANWSWWDYASWMVVLVMFGVSLGTRQGALGVVATVLYGVLWPWGLSLRGRTGSLQWTRRARTVALVGVLWSALLAILGLAMHAALGAEALAVWLVPVTLALAALVATPWESYLAGKFVTQAALRLRRVAPTVVAITGSYGKTSTKNHLADLLRGDGGVVATPKSFNNRAGLSRAINENLADGTRVFVAEMGTYGPGEIHDLCQWCTPDVAVITAIGPVHLERMKSLDVIERAKFEITEGASTVVVNIDDPRLAHWPARLAGRVRTAGSISAQADVRVAPAGDQWHVWVGGEDVAQMSPIPGVQASNVACAIAAALEVGALTTELSRRLVDVRAVANRATVATAASGVVVIDDTFNANPASARASLDLLSSLSVSGRRVVVTPGLIELGTEQSSQNEALARGVARRGMELVVVGRTNRGTLTRGYARDVPWCRVRENAVTWVRGSLTAGDAVLYLNDLPDQYP